jgi:TldD protein
MQILHPTTGGYTVTNIDRRDFLKKSGTSMVIAASSSLWYDLLFGGKIPPPSSAFFTDRFGVTRDDMRKILEIALSKGGDFSELFFEYRISNSVQMEEDIIKESSEDISLGLGIRVLNGEQTGYGYTNDLSFEKMKQTALTAAAIASSQGKFKMMDLTETKPKNQVYDLNRPLHSLKLNSKIDLVKSAYSSAKAYDSRISKVQAYLTDSIQYITIANSEGLIVSDARPQVRLIAISTADDGENRNTGFYSGGGRIGLDYFEKERTPAKIGTEASKEAVTLLSAVNAVPGEQPVVLGASQSGVMIHEAVGHPLEADGNRKKTSIMWDKLGKQVASPIVTITDDPAIPHYRGSLNVDDEGIEPSNAVLIEKGKLVGFLQDRLSAKLMKMDVNGHGRRQSYQHIPLPRMANTVLAKGDHDPEEIIRSVKKGFYAHSYQGGQVQDSGKFTFSVNLGYAIEDGKLTKPMKNATLIGTNVQILNEVDMIGTDMGFFLGTCGKEGQSAPVTAGTPTLKLRSMTVGGRT